MATGAPSGYNMYSLPTMGGGQKNFYDLISGKIQGGGSGGGGGIGDILQQLLSQASGKGEIFNQLEMPAKKRLQGDLAQIGSQFGLSGTNKSSGFQNAISGAGQNFAEDIYGQRANMMQQSIHDIMNLSNILLGMPTQEFGLQMKPGHQFMQSFGQGLGTGIGMLPGMFA